ncbi:MAG: nucleotidyl transferase AbiEii/AbiGii toxin family protein [Lentisphaerae bacterium]|nr:nucleotidyl transferase AbiEii/AbiGii toxin family protein [Lentisphaerota bacterium]
MNKVAVMPPAERADLFRETAERTGLGAALVEKDFWVCWALKHLFSIPEFTGRILFKGGTTLSKIFHVIRRFSEDIDLAVDWEMLGFVGDRSPHSEMSNTRRTKLLDEMLLACQHYIAGEFFGTFQARIESILRTADDREEWTLAVDSQYPNIVNFTYPRVIESPGYVKDMVVLEMGTHAEFIPRDDFVVTPYAADEFPSIFDDAACPVTAIKAERTFWEKATILHQEYHRPEERRIPDGYSRHYYDVAMLADSDIKTRALSDQDLLTRVVEHKKHFYPRRWARYDLAVPGTLRVIPSDIWVDPLRRDYERMQVMFFDPPPSFDAIVDRLAALDAEINGTAEG